MGLVVIHLSSQTEKIYLHFSKVVTWHALILREKFYGRKIYRLWKRYSLLTLAPPQFYPASI